MKRSIFFIISIYLLSISATFAQSENEIYQDVLIEMFKASGSEETFVTVIDQMVGMFKDQAMSDGVPTKFWDELQKEMHETALMDIVIMMVPVYQEHLSLDDLKAITAFYNSEVGKKFAAKTPIITQESMVVGGKWGEELAAKIVEKLEKEGY